MSNRIVVRTITAVFTLLLPLSVALAVPLMIPYSGTVAVNGEAFNGSGQFKFAIVNQACVTQQGQCETLWSNDGSSTQGGEPFNAVTVAVTQGKYSIKLGDIGLGNMTSVTEAAFGDDATYLRIWFNDGVTGSQQLSPDRQLVSVPYAFKASVANKALAVDNLPSGSVGAAQVNPAEVQLRGDMSCGTPNSYIHSIDEQGNVSCDPDNANSYVAGSGITIDILKNTISIANNGVATAKLQNNAVTDAKISDMSWNKLTAVPAGFADGIDNDTDTTYSGGSGISISGPTNQISVTTVPWGSISGVPAGFADGVDADTTYSAGSGISINPSNQISVTTIPWGSVSSIPADIADGVDDTAGVAFNFTNDLVSVNAGEYKQALHINNNAPAGYMAIISYSMRYSCKKSTTNPGGACYIYPSTNTSVPPSGHSSNMGYKEIALGSNAQLDGFISGNRVVSVNGSPSGFYLLIEADGNAVLNVDDVNFVVMFVPHTY